MKREELKAADVKKGISVLWETLQCPICLELMTAPVSTKCDHQFCKYCMTKLLENSKQNRASCPVCKNRVTRRSLQESPGFQKLVAGLQDMIHAYEHDTGMNYLTGAVLPKYPAVVADAGDRKTDEDPPELDSQRNVNNDVFKSQSSTIKAQNEFAILMGLEDSSPLITENEGLDSGLGGPSTASEIKKSFTTDVRELMTGQTPQKTRALIKSSDLPLIFEEVTVEEDRPKDEEGHVEDDQPVGELSRKRKKDSDPDKIFNRRQRKSVEKVREWLMTVPNEEDIELDLPERGAEDEDSDSFSSAPTIDLHQKNDDTFVNVKDGRPKALEDQVFGAVYKRGRKSNILVKRSPPHNISTHLSSEEVEPIEDKETNSDTEKRPQLINLFDDSSEFFKQTQLTNGEMRNESHTDKQPVQELQHVDKQSKDKCAPVCHMEPELKRRTRKQMRNEQEQFDSDLQEQIKTAQENTKGTVKNRKAGLQRAKKFKSGRVAKPLDLVEVSNGETALTDEPKSKLGSDKIQVHIENYPSSEDQDVSDKKITRKSKRLQRFAEEITGRKKVRRQLTVTKTNGEVAPEEVAPGKRNLLASQKHLKANGCVYADDLDGIEKLGLGETPKSLPPTQPLQKVPNVELPPEGDCIEPAAPDILGSQEDLAEINTVQESDTQTVPKDLSAESMDCEDDSELDTEQLLKSFKATKRKSFHLEAPSVKRSRCSAERERQKSEAIDVLENEKTHISGTFQDNLNSPFSDVVPPSASRGKAQHWPEFNEPDKPGSLNDVEPKSSSSALSPNLVAKFQTQSPSLSVIPKVANSGICFTAGHLSDSEESKKKTENEPSKLAHVSESQCSKADENSVSLLEPATTKIPTPQQLLHAECSLTPEGLLTRLPVPHIQSTNSNDSGSVQSPITSHSKRRKSRRLASSQELESSGEDLPSLPQILKRTSGGGQNNSEQVKVGSRKDETRLTVEEETQSSRPPQCPSPDPLNSSQASVDLFGTPEETGEAVPVNNASASMELSQFSSEVLVTQQKIEMQNELLRLEKLMALVTEVLHEKENHSENEQEVAEQNGSSQGPQASSVETEQEPERKGHQRADRNGRAGPSEVKAAPKPVVPKHGNTTDKNVTSSSPENHNDCESPSENKENNTPPDRRKPPIVLACSGLRSSEQMMVKKFAKRTGSRLVSVVTPDVTHIIMHTDERLVCERTLKYFLGIAGRKWVVSFQWISECFKQKKLLDESAFEVKGDVVNGHNHQGPLRARTRNDNDLLMKGYKICFQGPFADMTTDEMGWMVELCGATVVKDPSVLDGKQSHQLVIVQSGADISASKYNSLSRVATVVTRGWLLDSVSEYKIQNCKDYHI